MLVSIVAILAEWWEPLVGVLLAIATFALVGATIYLGKQTKAVANQTKALADQTKATEELTKASIRAAEALAIMPSLVFNLPQPLKDGAGRYARFSVKNIGFGHAKNPKVKVTTKDGRGLEVKPSTQIPIIEKDGLFYWDIYGVKVGEEVTIEVSFTDIQDAPKPPYKYTYVII